MSDKKCSSSHNFSHHNKPEGLPTTYIVNPKQKFNIRVFKGKFNVKISRQVAVQTFNGWLGVNETWKL